MPEIKESNNTHPCPKCGYHYTYDIGYNNWECGDCHYTFMVNNKKEYEKITVSLSPEILKQLEDGHYNKSSLIDSLLTKYFAAEKDEAKGEASSEKNN